MVSVWKKNCTSNSSMIVTECRAGYTGVGCYITCPYPLYGEYCQEVCSCSLMEFCDFVSGCLKSK